MKDFLKIEDGEWKDGMKTKEKKSNKFSTNYCTK
jgi:hypothetical protein